MLTSIVRDIMIVLLVERCGYTWHGYLTVFHATYIGNNLYMEPASA